MEQKRTLWIIAAVGVFLLVVLGAALILYSPTARANQTIASYQSGKNADSGWISLAQPEAKTNIQPSYQNVPENSFVNNQEKSQEVKTPAVSEEAKPVAAESTITHVGELTVYADKVTFNGKEASIETPQTVINNTTTIDLNATLAEPKDKVFVKAPVPVKAPEHKVEAKKQTQEAAVKPAETKQTVVKQTSSKAGNTTVNTSVKTTSPKNASVEVKTTQKVNELTQYWVQVVSLTSRKNADQAREVLGENKIPADVFTYTDSKNQLFYRVRVGPYTTKTEAEYWQTRIAKIDSFKNSQSYVASTKVTQ